MKAGSEKLLICRCAELLGTFSFTDKMNTEITKSRHDHWTAKCSLGQRGQEKNRWRRKDTLTAKYLRINVKN